MPLLLVAWDNLQHIIGGTPLFVLGFFFVYLGKRFYDFTTSYSVEKELVENDNPAFGLSFFGYMIGLSIAVFGSMLHLSGNVIDDSINISIGGLLAVVLMRLSVIINNKLILYKFDVDKEILKDINLGTGAVVFGTNAAAGLILSGSLSGSSPSLIDGIIDTTLYFLIAQIFLVIAALVFQKITDYDVHEVLEKDDNFAVGISFGSYLMAMGIIMRAVLAGTYANRPAEIVTICVFSVVSLVLLSAARVIADKVFMQTADLTAEVAEQKNTAAAMVAASSFISVGLLISAVLY